MKNKRQFYPTHIYDLPDVVLENILMRLSIQEAVSTSFVSKKWRHAWKGLPELVFDDMFCQEPIRNTSSKLIRAVNDILFLHKGPLSKFTLALSNLKSTYSDIDGFILHVLKKGVKTIIIGELSGEPYKLPSSIFAYSQQLEHLELCSCIFKLPPGIRGFKFNKLRHLVLREVRITGNRLSALISDCPKLERLEFTSSTPSACFDVVAPNLKSLKIQCLFQPLCFKSTPKLAQLEISSGLSGYMNILEEIEESSNLMLCGRLPMIEELELDWTFLQYVTSGKASRWLMKDLCHIKTLSLVSVCSCLVYDEDMLYALSLVKKCQSLEKLSIDIYTKDGEPDVEPTELTCFSDVSLDHLRQVEFRNVSGMKSELEFMKIILAKSPVLEKFLVEPDSNLVGDKGDMFFKKLSELGRASPLLEITYEY